MLKNLAETQGEPPSCSGSWTQSVCFLALRVFQTRTPRSDRQGLQSLLLTLGRADEAGGREKSQLLVSAHSVNTMTNFAGRTIWTGDNLDILSGLNSASVDPICLDPSFNSNLN